MDETGLNAIKYCPKCKETKAVTDFYNDSHTRDKLSWSCKLCAHKRRRESLARNPEAFKVKYRMSNLKRKLGLTIERYDEMWAEQEGRCAVCGTDEPKVRPGYATFCVDHSHVTGKVRGLLCNACNRGLGLLRDSEPILLNAAAYLRKHNEPTKSIS